jgi:glucokinase
VGDECVIGVDLGGTKLLAGVVDRDAAIHEQAERPTIVTSQDALLADLEDAARDLLASGAAAVGIGLPSLIDQRAGRAVASVNVPLTGIDARAYLSERLGVPVGIDNDANAAALAEHRFGAGRGSRHMILLTVGTGIGGGLILDGRIYRGSTGAGAELGHITIDEHGPRCQGTCPGIGHLEALASGTAITAAARRLADERPDGDLGRALAAGKHLDGRLVVEIAQRAPGDARSVLERAGEHLGVGIAGYVNVFNPEVVVVGGGFAVAGDLLLEPARRVVAEQALVPSRDEVRIVTAELGARAGLVGAALVGFEALERAAA